MNANVYKATGRETLNGIVWEVRHMVDIVSLTLGAVAVLVVIMMGFGVAFLARKPGYIVDMRDVRNYLMQVRTNKAVEEDIEESSN